MVELYLGLSLEFHDMQRLFGVDDVHGALWVNEKRVGIDHRLEPSSNPAMLGRYHFTLAHEARPLAIAPPSSFSAGLTSTLYLPRTSRVLNTVCRSSEHRTHRVSGESLCFLLAHATRDGQTIMA